MASPGVRGAVAWLLFAGACAACGGSAAPATRSTAGPSGEARPQPGEGPGGEGSTTTVTVEPPRADAGEVTVTHGDPDAGSVVGGAQEQPAAGPSAAERVRAMLDGLAPAPADEAAWFPFRVLETVARTSGELPAPTAPEVSGDRVVWSLVAPATPGAPDPAARANVCDEVARADARIACAADVVTVGATTRVRYAFAWRRAPGRLAADLALPLRALGRLNTGACLLAAERTLHTLEFRAQFPSLQSLGTSLALLATVPDLSDVIMVEAQPAPASANAPAGSIRALLSWPTDRADREQGDMGGDAWPARCEERLTVGEGAAPGARVQPLVVIQGQRARGAVVNLNHREWIVTEGDTVGDATVTAVAAGGVYVRREGNPRARPQFLRVPGATNTARGTARGPRNAPGGVAGPATAGPARGQPIRVPLPPEPPAAPPPPPRSP